jgi:hypothetical protein
MSNFSQKIQLAKTSALLVRAIVKRELMRFDWETPVKPEVDLWTLSTNQYKEFQYQ